jgi:transglutaminase-like putative cysteine protease
MKLSVTHELPSGIAPDSGRAVQHFLLTPPEGATQSILSWSIDAPGMDRAVSFTDAYGNLAHLVSRMPDDPDGPVRVTGVVETRDLHGVVGWDNGGPQPALFRRATALTRSPVTIHSKFRPAVEAGENLVDILHGLMLRLGEMFEFDPEAAESEDIEGEKKRLNAAAFAHTFVGGARALGIPARYVTGYYCSEDAGDPAFHAWAEALDPGLGWIGFDAAHGLCPTDRHIRLAIGLDEISTLPVRASPAAEEAGSGKVEVREVTDGQSQQQSQSQ